MATTTVIKSPKGPAAEYAKHSFSAYKRCPNACEYCYLNRGVLSRELGTGKPELRSCFASDDEVFNKFTKEILANKEQLIADGGIFFSFITDPCLPETFDLTRRCALGAMINGIPVTILTKMTGWLHERKYFLDMLELGVKRHLLCVGFTLTGRDEMEPNADGNESRIEAMKYLHEQGCLTFASVEPVIDFFSSLDMIEKTAGCCDLYRIGLRSGVKADYYDNNNLAFFIGQVYGTLIKQSSAAKVYWKESVRERFKDDSSFRAFETQFCVNTDYNIFKP